MNGTVVAQAVFDGLRYNFYGIKPSETYFETFEEAPNFIAKAVPGMMLMALTELVIKLLTGQMDGWRLHEAVISLSAGGLTEAAKNFAMRGAELTVYIWVYNNYRLFTFPWDSPYTYFLSIIIIDFGYYWWHRASHEMSLMWAGHHIHHSSEDFNMMTTFRSSFTVRPTKWIWFMHMAFMGIPPVTFMLHMHLLLVYGVWCHNELIPKLDKVIPVIGHWVESVLVTPSHHRVHHGANPYCIDKNYGEVLIIWDKMFGTYAEEREEEEITFGTIDNKPVKHILYVQVYPWVDLWNKVKSMDTVGNKLRAIFYGPGWQPGKPRLGDPKDIPDVRGRPKNQLYIPIWLSIYVACHAVLVFYSYIEMMGRLKTLGDWVPALNLVYIILTLASLGGIYEGHLYPVFCEPTRLFFYIFLLKTSTIIGRASEASFLTGNCYISLLLCPAIASAIFNRIKSPASAEQKQSNKVKSH